jgi:hypothetical protein
MCEACRSLTTPPAPAAEPSGSDEGEFLIEIRAFHNIATQFGRPLGFDGYVPGQPVVPVFATREPVGDLLKRCDAVFELLNIGDDPAMVQSPDPRAIEYRQRRNRSLSVGDVVSQSLGESTAYFAVARFGFERIDPPRIVRKTVPGTTPLDESDPADRS